METELVPGLTVENTLVNGRITSNTEWAQLHLPMEQNKRENGVMANSSSEKDDNQNQKLKDRIL